MHYVHNYVGAKEFHLVSEKEVPEGHVILSYQFEVTGKPDLGKGKGTPGIDKLFINEKQVGQMELPVTIPISIGIVEGLKCGTDAGSKITELYEPPFAFTGNLKRLWLMSAVSG